MFKNPRWIGEISLADRSRDVASISLEYGGAVIFQGMLLCHGINDPLMDWEKEGLACRCKTKYPVLMLHGAGSRDREKIA